MSFGAVAQLGEHLVCNQGVVGSSPISSTKKSIRAPSQALAGAVSKSLGYAVLVAVSAVATRSADLNDLEFIDN